jgi:hypothetical protein
MNSLQLSLSYGAIACAGAMLIVDLVDAESSAPSDTTETLREVSEEMIDLALGLTFPASDPPAWTKAIQQTDRYQEKLDH